MKDTKGDRHILHLISVNYVKDKGNMDKHHYVTPTARAPVADPNLLRPDWTLGVPRKPNLLWLDKNENNDPELAEVVRRVLAEIPIESLYCYPESGPLYRKLAARLGVGPENLLLSAGSDGAIRSAFEAYIAPGDVVLHTQPTFAMYFVYSKMYGAFEKNLVYQPSVEGPVLDAAAVVQAIEEFRPKMVCLPNPDSPTGTVFSLDDLKTIIEGAGNAGALLLIDEAYYPFHEKTVLPWVLDYPHLMVTRSTGKAWGLAGFRLGLAAAGPEVVMCLHKVRPMYEVNTVAVAVMEKMLDHEDEMIASVERLEKGKRFFLGAMSNLGFRVLRGQGNFLHVAFGVHAEAIHKALSNMVYYRRDFNDPCLEGFSRFSSTTTEQFKPVIDRIAQIVS